MNLIPYPLVFCRGPKFFSHFTVLFYLILLSLLLFFRSVAKIPAHAGPQYVSPGNFISGFFMFSPQTRLPSKVVIGGRLGLGVSSLLFFPIPKFIPTCRRLGLGVSSLYRGFYPLVIARPYAVAISLFESQATSHLFGLI
jgi:hypothetical protein